VLFDICIIPVSNIICKGNSTSPPDLLSIKNGEGEPIRKLQVLPLPLGEEVSAEGGSASGGRR